MEGDGHTREPVTMRVRLVVRRRPRDRRLDGLRPAGARARCNATFGVTVSAACNAFLQVSDAEIPRNAGRYGCITTIAPPGSVVNVRFPGPSVGGNTETQPKLVGMLLGALAERDARPRDGGRGRDGVQLPLRWHPPGDGRAVRPLPLRGERLGRPRRRRRAERPEPHPRQLPQHADRGVRDALPVPHAVVRARSGLGRPGPAPRRAGRAARPRGAGARDDRERDVRPRRARRVGPLRRAGRDAARRCSCGARATTASATSARRSAPSARRSSRASCCARATSCESRARAAAASATRASATRSSSLRDVRAGLVSREAAARDYGREVDDGH